MELKIALAGNPNSGKTTLFNALTGSNQFVGNWPGVTVEKKEGRLKKHSDVVITDLPGIYSLSPYTLEEVVARNYLIDQRPDAILNIIDGTNLERNLYLTTQLTELGIPVVIAINMMDVVRKNGDKINTKELSDALGCQVVEISALRGDGIMEAAGAAWATVIGQFVSLIVIAAVYFKKGVGLESGMRYLKPEKKTLGSIYAIGLPAIVMQILTPIMSYALNLILGAVSVSAVTAYGVYYKLQNFIFMPGYGLNNASIPIISYNFGAKNKARVSQTIRYGLIYVSVIMLIGIILLQLFARQIVGIFSVTEESHQLCVLALRIITCGFFFAGANIILQGVCQALGKGGYSLVISLLRFVVLALPLAWALSLTENAASLVWLSLPVAEAGACLVAVLLTRKTYRCFDTQATGICK